MTESIKKQTFGRRGGGEINSYFDFLGKINSIFPLDKSKSRYFSDIFLTVLTILFVYVYYFVHFIYEFKILPLLGQNILGKIN